MADTLRTSPDRQRFLALRMQTLARVPGFRGGAAAEAQLASLWTRAESLGVVHLHRPDAQLVAFRDPVTWFGGPATLCFVDRDPRSELGLRAAVAAVRACRDVLDETTWLEVDAYDLELVHALIAEGFGIDSVQQLGDARLALERLIAEKDPPLTVPGLTIEDARLGDVDPIVLLHQAAFSRHPEHCFFGAYREHLLRLRDDVHATIRQAANLGREPLHWVVRGRGKVLGHVEAEVTHDHPWWGNVAGLALVFDPSIQGRGVVKTAYRVALTLAVARGAERIKGGTSQPAVLGLGQVMGRPWLSIGLRRHTHYPPQHFLRFHPELTRAR